MPLAFKEKLRDWLDEAKKKVSLNRCGTMSTGDVKKLNAQLEDAKEFAYKIWRGNHGGGMPAPK